MDKRSDAASFCRSWPSWTAIVEKGPDRNVDGVVRWRRIDLKRVIAERLGIDYRPRYVGKLLKKPGFPASAPGLATLPRTSVEAFKKRARVDGRLSRRWKRVAPS